MIDFEPVSEKFFIIPSGDSISHNKMVIYNFLTKQLNSVII